MSFHHILVTAGLVLLAFQAVKLLGVLSAIRWILAHGEDFIERVKGRQAAYSPTVYWELLDATGAAKVFPLGVLEYRLHRFAATRRRKSLGFLIRAGRALAFDFTALGLYSAAYLFIAGTPALRSYSSGSVVTIAWASAALATLQLIAIYGEACVSYAKIGSYGLGFHGAGDYVRLQRSGIYLAEARTLVGAVMYSLLISALIFYFSAANGAVFGSIQVTRSAPLGALADLLNCFYFAIVTFFTADTPDAENGLARLATIIPVTHAGCALILALATATMFIAPSLKPVPPVDSGPAETERPAPAVDSGPAETARPVPRRRSGTAIRGFLLGAVTVIVLRRALKRRGRA